LGLTDRIVALLTVFEKVGVAVRHDERDGVGAARANMRELNLDPIDLGDELGASVQP
jgi:hypothetical protein